MHTPLFKTHLQVEQKQITFVLEENAQGTFLRITEEVHGHRNSIVIPITGLEPFRDSLNEAIKFNQTSVGAATVFALGQRKAETPGS